MNSETPTTVRATFFRRQKYTIAIACGAALLLALVSVWQSAAKAARERQWRNNQEVVVNAIENYRSFHGDFPPASILDEDGRSMHSWRVLLVPFIQQNLFYSQYHLDEPWNGPSNQRLLQEYSLPPEVYEDVKEIHDITEVRYCYQHPEYTPYGSDCQTNVVMVVDPNQPPIRSTSRNSRINGNRGWQAQLHAGNDLMIVGVSGSDIHWMEPRDMSPEKLISLSKASRNSSNSAPHLTDSFVVSENGTVQFLNKQETLERLEELQQDSRGVNPQ